MLDIKSKTISASTEPSLSTGVIVAIVIVSLLSVALVIGAVFFCKRRMWANFKNHVMYYKDMAEQLLEEDFDLEREDDDTKVYEDRAPST